MSQEPGQNAHPKEQLIKHDTYGLYRKVAKNHLVNLIHGGHYVD
jgi:hypothetical protein